MTKADAKAIGVTALVTLIVVIVVLALRQTAPDQPVAREQAKPAPAPTAPAPPQQPAAVAKFEASEALSSFVINPATLRLVVQVTNTGDAPGKPSCNIRVQDSSGTYRGFDTFTDDKEVAPGEKHAFAAQLTVTKEGAAYVTEQSINCQPQ